MLIYSHHRHLFFLSIILGLFLSYSCHHSVELLYCSLFCLHVAYDSYDRRNMMKMWSKLKSSSHLLSWSAKRTTEQCASAPITVSYVASTCTDRNSRISYSYPLLDLLSTTFLISPSPPFRNMFVSLQDLYLPGLCHFGGTRPGVWWSRPLSLQKSAAKTTITTFYFPWRYAKSVTSVCLFVVCFLM